MSNSQTDLFRNRLLVTHSRVLSSRLLKNINHIGIQAHSFESLVDWLFNQSSSKVTAGSAKSFSQLDQLSFIEGIRETLSEDNYFKEALIYPGIAEAVLRTINQLRLCGFTSENLAISSMNNLMKLQGLTKIFHEFETSTENGSIIDHADRVLECCSLLKNGSFDELVNNLTVTMPFELSLFGYEQELLSLLADKGCIQDEIRPEIKQVATTETTTTTFSRFRDTLSLQLTRPVSTPIPGDSPVFADDTLTIRGRLRADEQIADALEWALDRGFTADDFSICALDYDTYAGSLLRISERLGIQINLGHGLSAREFGYFAKDMSALGSAVRKMGPTCPGRATAKEFLNTIRKIKHDDKGFRSYRRKTIAIAKEWLSLPASESATTAEFSDYITKNFRSIRISSKDLEADSGLFIGRPIDLLGSENRGMAVVGLTDDNYPPRPVQDPVLLDEERSSINSGLPEGALPLPLSGLTPQQKDILEKVVVDCTEAIYLGYLSHDLGSGSFTVPSPFLLRTLITLGVEPTLKALTNLSGAPSQFVPQPGVSAVFADFGTYSASHKKVLDNFERYENTSAAIHSNERSLVDGISDPSILSSSKDPLSISASSLQKFFKCPYSYYLEKIVGLREIDKVEGASLEWLDPRDYGSFVHRVLEIITNKFLGLGSPTNDSWVQFLAENTDVFVREAITAAEEEEQFSKLKTGIPATLIDRERDQISLLVNEFVTRDIARAKEDKFYPIGVEVKFSNLNIDVEIGSQKSTVAFNGFIDRVDTDGLGKFRVIDYKTGTDRLSKSDSLFLDTGKNPQFQHAIYGLWALNQSGESPKPENIECAYYFIGKKSDWSMPKGIFNTFGDTLKNAATAVAAARSKGEFQKNSESCQYCNYKLVCKGRPKDRTKKIGIPQQISELQSILTGSPS